MKIAHIIIEHMVFGMVGTLYYPLLMAIVEKIIKLICFCNILKNQIKTKFQVCQGFGVNKGGLAVKVPGLARHFHD
jgi:hypothetical protein